MYQPRNSNAKVYLAICDNCGDTRIEGKHKKPFYCHNCTAKVTAQLLPYETALFIRQEHLKKMREKKEKK